MAGGWSTRRVDDLDDIGAWMARRNADLALRPEADGIARDLWNQATQDGQDLYAPQPSDLTAIGLASARGGGLRALGPDVGGAPDLTETPPILAANDAYHETPQPQSATPTYRMVTARPGDNISRLMGTSRPDAVGRFAGLNGLSNSTLQAGESYYIPGSYDDATQDEVAAGKSLLRADNARLAAARAPANLSGRRLSPGLDVRTGESPEYARPGGVSSANPSRPWWDRSTTAKVIGGGAAYLAGVPVGAGRAVADTVGDIWDTDKLAAGLSGVLGYQAQVEAIDRVGGMAAGMAHAAGAAIKDPAGTLQDAWQGLGAGLQSMSPLNAPMSGSLTDVMGQEFGAGKNLGDTATNIAGMGAGFELAKGVWAAKMFEGTRAANMAKLVNQGLPPEAASYLTKRYDGMGHHSVLPARTKIPTSILGIPVDKRWAGRRLPPWLIDNPLNISKPLGMSQGDFYAHHFRTDPKAYGFRLPADVNGGKGWSGRKLGLTRYNPVERVWNGTPVPLKGAMAAVPLRPSWASDDLSDRDSPQ